MQGTPAVLKHTHTVKFLFEAIGLMCLAGLVPTFRSGRKRRKHGIYVSHPVFVARPLPLPDLTTDGLIISTSSIPFEHLLNEEVAICALQEQIIGLNITPCSFN